MDDIQDPVMKAIMGAFESQTRHNDAVQHALAAVTARVNDLHAEIAELRDELLALANRIESTNRVLASRTEHLA